MHLIVIRRSNNLGNNKVYSFCGVLSAPCPPLGITYSINNGSAMLSWNASVLATEYAVYELKGADLLLLCRTAQLQCYVTGANRSAIQVMAINAAGQSNPSTNIQGKKDNTD